MDAQTREIVAIGASVTALCQPCLEYHVQQARQLGVPEEDINDAVETGKMVRKGAATKFDRFAASVQSPAEQTAKGCGCA